MASIFYFASCNNCPHRSNYAQSHWKSELCIDWHCQKDPVLGLIHAKFLTSTNAMNRSGLDALTTFDWNAGLSFELQGENLAVYLDKQFIAWL